MLLGSSREHPEPLQGYLVAQPPWGGSNYDAITGVAIRAAEQCICRPLFFNLKINMV